jgi:hypothetical protein
MMLAVAGRHAGGCRPAGRPGRGVGCSPECVLLQAENVTGRQQDLMKIAENTKKNLENEVSGYR